MSKIKSKSLIFDESDMTDIKEFNVYYCLSIEELTYDTPKVVIPVVSGQTAYEVTLPTLIPAITEGEYKLGVAAVDTSENISDINVMTSFFDFAPPKAPTWR